MDSLSLSLTPAGHVLLRSAEPHEPVSEPAAGGAPVHAAIGKEHLAEIFGIEMEGAGQAATAKNAKRARRAAKQPARRRARGGGGGATGVGSFTSVRRR